MHKIQINYLYSSFVFVLITISSFALFTAEAGFIPYSSYSIGKPGLGHYTKTECKASHSDRFTDTQSTEDLLFCLNEQKNYKPITKNKISISLFGNAERTAY